MAAGHERLAALGGCVFCSFACDLLVTQPVHGIKGIHAIVRRDAV
ncbi:MAG TPA: hypothetical protein VLD36_23265 [Burkholderiales bacterium]|nr:hypothetical protein [Burkholderiales bacterium]